MHKIIRKILPAVLTASLLVPIPILGEEISASEISLEGTAAEEAAAEAGTAKEAAAEEETAEETVTEEETSTEAAAENTGEAAAAQQSADVEASGEVIEETAVRDTAGTVSEEEDAGTSPAETAGTESSAELTAGTESPAEETSSGENSLAGETEEVPEMELTGNFRGGNRIRGRSRRYGDCCSINGRCCRGAVAGLFGRLYRQHGSSVCGKRYQCPGSGNRGGRTEGLCARSHHNGKRCGMGTYRL